MIITVSEAHQRFGDLARIRNGMTTWIEVEEPTGTWKPVFLAGWQLVGYEFHPNPTAGRYNCSGQYVYPARLRNAH